MGQDAQTQLTRYEPRFGDRAMQLSEAIAFRRERLGFILAELDRRRRDFFDVRKQLRQNVKPLLLLLGGVGCAVALGLVMRSRRHRNERRLSQRVSKATAALRRAVKDPDRVAAPPPDLGKKVLIAVASGAATTLVTAVVKRWVEVFVVPRVGRERERERMALPAAVETRASPREVRRDVGW